MKIDFSDEIINKMAPLHYDTKLLTEQFFLPDKIIDINDILEYVLNGKLKFHIKNNIVISGDIDPSNTFAVVI